MKTNRAQQAQQRAVQMKIHEMTEWYASQAGGKFPDHLAEDKKTYRGKILRWLEPQIPGVDNPILIEESLGDSWTLRFEKSRPEIKVYMP